MTRLWREKRGNQLNAMLASLPQFEDRREEFLAASKENPVRDFDPISQTEQFSEQSDLSFKEQRTAISIAISSINKYQLQFGKLTRTKNILTTGIPGSGKTHVLLTQGLYAVSRGLRVMATSLMAVRSLALGGIHMHKLFALQVGKYTNPYKLADLALHKLRESTHFTETHTFADNLPRARLRRQEQPEDDAHCLDIGRTGGPS